MKIEAMKNSDILLDLDFCLDFIDYLYSDSLMA